MNIHWHEVPLELKRKKLEVYSRMTIVEHIHVEMLNQV
jgi:hypothetical protein